MVALLNATMEWSSLTASSTMKLFLVAFFGPSSTGSSSSCTTLGGAGAAGSAAAAALLAFFLPPPSFFFFPPVAGLSTATAPPRTSWSQRGVEIPSSFWVLCVYKGERMSKRDRGGGRRHVRLIHVPLQLRPSGLVQAKEAPATQHRGAGDGGQGYGAAPQQGHEPQERAHVGQGGG